MMSCVYVKAIELDINSWWFWCGMQCGACLTCISHLLSSILGSMHRRQYVQQIEKSLVGKSTYSSPCVHPPWAVGPHLQNGNCRTMPGPEPELHGFARMVGNGVWIPNRIWDSGGLWCKYDLTSFIYIEVLFLRHFHPKAGFKTIGGQPWFSRGVVAAFSMRRSCGICSLTNALWPGRNVAHLFKTKSFLRPKAAP